MGPAVIVAIGAFLAFKYLGKSSTAPSPSTETPPNPSTDAPNQITDNMLKKPVEVAGASSRPPTGTDSGGGGTTTTGDKTQTPIKSPSTTILGTTYPVSSGVAGTSSGGYDPNETRTIIASTHGGHLYY